MKRQLSELAAAVPTDFLENFVTAFEAGRVQRHPGARFVNRLGECCIVGGLAGAIKSSDMVSSAIWSRFLGTELEELSRRFESRRLSGQEFYEEALLALAERRATRSLPAPSVVTLDHVTTAALTESTRGR